MEQVNVNHGTAETLNLLNAYVEERVVPHPILNRFLNAASICVTGSVAAGTWDEQSSLDVRFVLPDSEHIDLADELQTAHLWDPARDLRLRLRDGEPFRRFPGTEIVILSETQLWREFQWDLPIALWVYRHGAMLQDPLGILERATEHFSERFRSELPNLRCEHYYLFRQARNDLAPKIMPRRASTLMAIKRGEAVREALRLAFLADQKPYPYDKLLETIAEQQTRAGSHIVTAVRALVAAHDPETVEHAGKVLRDRVAFALQQGGVSEAWLEQWWTWPYVAPMDTER